jgi:hypothetical protein
VGLLAAACTTGTDAAESPSPPSSGIPPAPGPSLGPRSTLCQYPEPHESPPPTSAPALTPAVEAVASQVTQVRDLRWADPVEPEAVSQQRLGQILSGLVAEALPAQQLARRSRAWITMGALPPGSSLRSALLAYDDSEVVGFYDTLSHRLVYSGTTNPTPYQRYVLSHELTHALDDQRFDLSREDALAYRCADEPMAAFIALTEGDAVYSSNAWARRFLSNDEIGRLQQEASSFPPPPAIPPFVQELQDFPYEAGLSFVQALVDRGGERAVDAAFRNPPVSTEQILHPDAYPADRPVPVTVTKPDGLGAQWTLIDQMEVGEAWLKLLLQLKLPAARDAEATDFWDGAEYKAWSNGHHTVVVLRTAWDTEGDATQFGAALESFTGSTPARVTRSGRDVTAVFASDAASLAAATS